MFFEEKKKTLLLSAYAGIYNLNYLRPKLWFAELRIVVTPGLRIAHMPQFGFGRAQAQANVQRMGRARAKATGADGSRI